MRPTANDHQPLYTPDERRRRDASRWTFVQGVLAPLQFLVFLVSLVLVVRYLITGLGLGAATASIVLKTLVLYAIMVTGSRSAIAAAHGATLLSTTPVFKHASETQHSPKGTCEPGQGRVSWGPGIDI